MTNLKGAVGRGADWVLHQQPVQSAGALCAVVLGVLAWFGLTPNSEQVQIIGTAVAVMFPLFTHWLAHLKAWAPASVDRELDVPSDQRSVH